MVSNSVLLCVWARVQQVHGFDQSSENQLVRSMHYIHTTLPATTTSQQALYINVSSPGLCHPVPLHLDTYYWFVITLCVGTPSGDCARFEAPVKSKCMTEDDQSNESALLDEEESLLVTNRLHQVLRPFMLRRLKESVAKELPQKVHQLLYPALPFALPFPSLSFPLSRDRPCTTQPSVPALPCPAPVRP